MLWQPIKSGNDATAEAATECARANSLGAARGIITGLIISFPLWCLIVLVVLQLS